MILWGLFMGILMMAGAVFVPYLRDGGQALHPLYLGLAGGLTLAAVLYACLFEQKASEGFLFWLIPIAYLISVAFLLLFDNPFTFPFWTFGGMLLLCAFRLRYGMFLNVFLLFIIGSRQTEIVTEVLIIQILCLLLFGFVMPYAKVWKDTVNVLISVAAVLISVRIVCFFTMEKEALTGDIFCVAVVYAIVVCAVVLLSKGLRESIFIQEQTEHFDFLEELAAGAEEQDAGVSEYIALTEGNDREAYVFERTFENVSDTEYVSENSTLAFDGEVLSQLEELSKENAPLLQQMQQTYPKAFLHARRVALFASEVAERLEGVNVTLTKCGGYYHEIGRLRGEKTLGNTLAVADESGFPTVLRDVLREHTVGGDKPTSKEAALVLLTDNICGMCEHLKKTQKGTILISKVIDRALNLRLTKGDLSQSGLSAKDLSVTLNTMSEVIKEDMF